MCPPFFGGMRYTHSFWHTLFVQKALFFVLSVSDWPILLTFMPTRYFNSNTILIVCWWTLLNLMDNRLIQPKFHRKIFGTDIRFFFSFFFCSLFLQINLSPSFLGGTTATTTPIFLIPQTPPWNPMPKVVYTWHYFVLTRLVTLFNNLQLLLHIWNSLFIQFFFYCHDVLMHPLSKKEQN